MEADNTKKNAQDIFNSAAINNPKKSTGPVQMGELSILRYPQDLSSAQHPHYVMFFVSVRKSDLSEIEKANVASFSFDNSKMNRPNPEGNGATVLGGIAGGTAGAGVGANVGSAVGELASSLPNSQKIASTRQLGNVVGGAAGTLGGAAVGAGLANSFGERDQVLLKDVVALYLSNKPVSSFSASWGEEDLGVVGGLSVDNAGIDPVAMGQAALLKYSEGKTLGAFGNPTKAFEATAGVTPNPFKAQLFKAMKFRTFSFDHVFMPRNKSEYIMVKQIINIFKKYMHPVLGQNKYIMRYPAEFTIQYFFKNNSNNELFRISNCALTDCTVEYGGTDFTTFSGIDGAPTEIKMKLKFTELEMLTRDRFEEDNF